MYQTTDSQRIHVGPTCSMEVLRAVAVATTVPGETPIDWQTTCRVPHQQCPPQKFRKYSDNHLLCLIMIPNYVLTYCLV